MPTISSQSTLRVYRCPLHTPNNREQQSPVSKDRRNEAMKAITKISTLTSSINPISNEKITLVTSSCGEVRMNRSGNSCRYCCH